MAAGGKYTAFNYGGLPNPGEFGFHFNLDPDQPSEVSNPLNYNNEKNNDEIQCFAFDGE